MAFPSAERRERGCEPQVAHDADRDLVVCAFGIRNGRRRDADRALEVRLRLGELAAHQLGRPVREHDVLRGVVPDRDVLVGRECAKLALRERTVEITARRERSSAELVGKVAIDDLGRFALEPCDLPGDVAFARTAP